MPLRAVGRSLDRLDLRGARLLVAVSGGIDSVTLLDVLVRLRETQGLALDVGHVDHGLRGEASRADARLVEALAHEHGLRFAAVRVAPEAARAGLPSRARPTLQEAARRLRYEALTALAGRFGADAVATGHTLDDQAETVLLRLLRGSGPDGLRGIAERSHAGRVVRPLLEVSRAAIVAHAQRHRLRWREDASNRSDAYARNRLRRDWLPGLARAFNPQLLRAIGNLAEAQRRDSEWIAQAVESELRQRVQRVGDEIHVIGEGFDRLAPALARRVARSCLESAGAGREVSRVHLDRTVAFLARSPAQAGGRAIELPGGLRLERRAGRFRLYRPAACTVRRLPEADGAAC